MNPFYFGASKRSLFGIYEQPRARASRTTGVVICPPFGHEYARSHRVLRQLALMLAEHGCHVLRFDWFATGDSSGDPLSADLRGWIGDVTTAIEELKDMTGVPRVSLVGARLGASLALAATAKRRDVEGVVLWDPVVSGREYLAELRDLNERFLHHEYPPPRLPHENEDLDGLLGQAWPSALRQELENFSLESLAGCGARVVHLLTSEQHPTPRIRERLERMGVRVTGETCASAEWTETRRVVTAMLPHQLNQVLDQMTLGAMAGAA